MKTLLTALAFAAALPCFAAWEVKEEPGKYLDVQKDGATLARFMTAYDPKTKESLHETYKPYLHVFDAAGKGPITKGAGGDFTHHRGIFIGWNKIKCGGKEYDRWHMKGGEQVHKAFAGNVAGAAGATVTSQIEWNDEKGAAFLKEARTMKFSPGPAPAYLQIDFSSTLTPVAADVSLGGDPEHAGCHFRPAQDIVRNKTEYLYPKTGADAHKDRDYPWVAEHFFLPGGDFSVAHLNHPANPKGTLHSAYRDYGRFGAFPTAEIKAGESKTFQYRFLICSGDLPSAAVIQKAWDEFAGAAGSPVPETTRKPAEGAKK